MPSPKARTAFLVPFVSIFCCSTQWLEAKPALKVQCWCVAIVPIPTAVAEHVFLQFWELDNDHDFLISKDDLVRYGNHSLTYRIVERIFLQASELSACL